MLKPFDIVLGGALRCDQESVWLEAHLPVVIAGAIARLKRSVDIARREAQPALLCFAQKPVCEVAQDW